MDRNGAVRVIDDTLEAEFALRKRHPEREAIYDDHKSRSAIVRTESACILDQRYAIGPRCLLDIFPAGNHAPVLLFIHGGYWRALDKSYVSFIAAPFQNAGLTVVIPGYDLVPRVSVAEIVDQMRAALNWVIERLAPQRIVVAGHSAGGQLAAMLALDQAARGGGPIVGVAGVSGVFDLRPLLRTSINIDLMLSAKEAAEASPLLRAEALAPDAPLVPLLGIVGGDETQGFKLWTTDFVAAWRARGAPAELMEIAGRNHFTILDALAEPGDLLRSVRALAYGPAL
jgi:arylformamidase